MSERARQLVDQLRGFRSRKDAMNELLMLGEAALPELIRALGHPMENVRWAVQQVLVRLGGDAVVQTLIEILDDPTRRNEAADVLRQITGQSITADRQAWAAWHQQGKVPRPAAEPVAAPPEDTAEAPTTAVEPAATPPQPEPLSDDEIVQAAIRDTETAVRQHSGGYVLTVPLEGRRRQRVTVSFSARDFEGEPLVVVYTECGPADPKNHEWALRQNVRMSFGAIALRDRGGVPTFVMVNTHPRATLDVDELRKSILILAEHGDKLEKAITKADER